MSLSNKESNIYDELTELSDENSVLREKLAVSEYNEVMLTRTVSALQDVAIKDYVRNKLKVAALQKKLDKRVLN